MRGGREGLQTTSMRTGHEMVETSLDNGGDTNDHPQSRPHRGAPRPRPRGFPQPPNGPSARLPRLRLKAKTVRAFFHSINENVQRL